MTIKKLYVVAHIDDGFPIYVCEATCEESALLLAADAHKKDADEFIKVHYVSHSQFYDTKYLKESGDDQ